MISADDLLAAMRGWDRKSATALRSLYICHNTAPAFLPTLVAACSSADTACAATWLIRHHCAQSNGTLPPDLCRAFYASPPHLEGWQARLHVLQCLEDLPVPETAARTVFEFAASGAVSDNKLVRAWSLYGAAKLAQQHPGYDDAARALLDAAAAQKPTGAVAVRLRAAKELLPDIAS